MFYTFVLDKENYQKKLTNTISNINEVVNSNRVAYQSFVTDKIVTSLRIIRERQGVKSMVEGMLLEACYKAELAGAGSASLCSLFSLALIEQITKLCEVDYNFKDLRQEALEGLGSFRNHLNALVTDPTEQSLQKAVNGAVNSPLLAEMVLEAFALGGIEGTVFPEHTKNITPSVELVSGYRFSINLPKSFYDNTGKWKRQYPKVLIIDGMVEKVSEIHGILERASKEKEPIAFITRGFGDEVLHTLKLNQDRGTLDIIPIIVPFDLEGINMLNDISAVCGVDVVSSLKGDLISAIQYDDLKSVDSIICQNNLLIILNKSTEKKVRDHTQFLIKKQEEQSVEDISDLILKRIRSLSSCCVRLRIASKSQQEEIKDFEAIDVGLRTVKSVMSYGVINVSTIEFSEGLFGRVWNQVKDKFGQMPIMSVLSAVHHATSFATMICSVEKAVIVTQ